MIVQEWSCCNVNFGMTCISLPWWSVELLDILWNIHWKHWEESECPLENRLKMSWSEGLCQEDHQEPQSRQCFGSLLLVLWDWLPALGKSFHLPSERRYAMRQQKLLTKDCQESRKARNTTTRRKKTRLICMLQEEDKAWNTLPQWSGTLWEASWKDSAVQVDQTDLGHNA